MLVVALVFAFGVFARGVTTGRNKMASSQEIANSILSIQESQYFEKTEDLFTDLEIRLSETDFFGVALNAPRVVSIIKTPELPVIIAIQQTGLRGWEIPRDANGVLVATDMNNRTVYFGQVFRDSENKIPMSGVHQPLKPEGAAAISIQSGLTRLDARRVLSLPWKSGRYRLSALLFDWKSNPVEVTLTGGTPPSASIAPPVALPPGEAGKNNGLPTFLQTEKSPSFSGKNRPDFTFQVKSGKGQGSLLKIVGAFATLANVSHIPAVPYKVKEVGGEEKIVGAVVPATLAVFGKNWSAPLRLDWAFPVYSQTPVKSGDLINGFFSIDALAGKGMSLEKGDYVVYLITEGEIFGPIAFRYDTE